MCYLLVPWVMQKKMQTLLSLEPFLSKYAIFLKYNIGDIYVTD